MKSRKKTSTFKRQGSRAYFRLLGLKRGETRVNVIRSAAQAMSVSLTHSESLLSPHVADDRRAQIAVAAYRLLDPRERSDLYERVQLVFPIDREDMDTPVIAANTLIDQMPALPGHAKPEPKKEQPKASDAQIQPPRNAHRRAPRPHSEVKLMDQSVIDDAIDDKAGAERVISLEKASERDDSSLSIEERRNIVRALRKASTADRRRNAPLAWFRTKLGM
jgi:hypothetical protein